MSMKTLFAISIYWHAFIVKRSILCSIMSFLQHTSTRIIYHYHAKAFLTSSFAIIDDLCLVRVSFFYMELHFYWPFRRKSSPPKLRGRGTSFTFIAPMICLSLDGRYFIEVAIRILFDSTLVCVCAEYYKLCSWSLSLHVLLPIIIASHTRSFCVE